MTMNAVILRKGKDKAVRNRHHWIFSGTVSRMPEGEDGEIHPVMSHDGDLLGHAYINSRCSIVGRMLSFGKEDPLKAVAGNIESAVKLRRLFFDKDTNAYRLINGEGDRLPGLVADLYDDILVIQVATLGMEKLKPFLLDAFIRTIRPRCIYEKSTLPSRHEEGLADSEGFLFGDKVERVEIKENGVKFIVDIPRSQKTGFFLDQREMRRLVFTLSRDKKVLDAFSYTGGFSVSALKGGAQEINAVDSSQNALSLAKENLALNGFRVDSRHFIAEDVFLFLRNENLSYDFIILDPPGFAKKKGDVIQACRGYKDINRLAMKRIGPSGLLLTFSCSHFVGEELFQKVVFQAAQEAGRRARIIHRHRHAFDHPVNIFHPESHYLKGLLLYID